MDQVVPSLYRMSLGICCNSRARQIGEHLVFAELHPDQKKHYLHSRGSVFTALPGSPLESTGMPLERQILQVHKEWNNLAFLSPALPILCRLKTSREKESQWKPYLLKAPGEVSEERMLALWVALKLLRFYTLVDLSMTHVLIWTSLSCLAFVTRSVAVTPPPFWSQAWGGPFMKFLAFLRWQPSVCLAISDAIV